MTKNSFYGFRCLIGFLNLCKNFVQKARHKLNEIPKWSQSQIAKNRDRERDPWILEKIWILQIVTNRSIRTSPTFLNSWIWDYETLNLDVNHVPEAEDMQPQGLDIIKSKKELNHLLMMFLPTSFKRPGLKLSSPRHRTFGKSNHLLYRCLTEFAFLGVMLIDQ